MDDQTRRELARAPDPPGEAAITGVARGSLGTATALDETQEWVIPPELQAAPDPARVVLPASASVESAAAQPRHAAVAAVPAVEPARPSRHPDRTPSPRTAGIAVALLLGAIAVVAVASSLGSFASPGQLPPGADQATTAPAATEDPDGDDEDDADDGDDGGGRGGGGNGGGNGNGGGRGNGNGNGGGGGRGND